MNIATSSLSFLIPLVDITGTIVTDCDSCILAPADITSFSLTYSGFLNDTFAGTSANVTGAAPYPLSASGGIILDSYTGGMACTRFG